MLVQFFVPHPAFAKIYEGILRWAIVMGVFAVAIGIGTLIRLHIKRVSSFSSEWIYSVVVLVGILITGIAGIVGGPRGKWIGWISHNILVPLDATMFSLLAFFMASAAYRAFRARTVDATLLLAAAIIVMFGKVPIGDFLWQAIAPQSLIDKIPSLPERLAEWIMSSPNMAARRGIMIGAALGAISTSLKIILGLERTYFGGSGE
jgi:hypothetical protein